MLEVIIAVIIVLVIFIYSNDLDFADQADAFQVRIVNLTNERDSLSTELRSKISEIRELERANQELREENEFSRICPADGDDISQVFSVQERILNLEDTVGILEDQLRSARSALKW